MTESLHFPMLSPSIQTSYFRTNLLHNTQNNFGDHELCQNKEPSLNPDRLKALV